MEDQELIQSLGGLLSIVNLAVDSPLSRVWLNGPGDLCAECAMRPECPDQSRCLHLAVSTGLTRRTDGPFRRFPLGARKVGEVAITRTPYVAREEIAETGLADPAWLHTHGIRGFAALPIVTGERCLGVLALFSRREIAPGELALLEGAARCAAAIVSAARERAARELVRPGAERSASADPTGDPGAPDAAPARELRTLAAIERDAIERVLRHTGGRVSGPRGAAKILGLKPTTLESRMKKLGARKPPLKRGR
jgi:transcriptional regulator with GAF, ATPase, and Fis domain